MRCVTCVVYDGNTRHTRDTAATSTKREGTTYFRDEQFTRRCVEANQSERGSVRTSNTRYVASSSGNNIIGDHPNKRGWFVRFVPYRVNAGSVDQTTRTDLQHPESNMFCWVGAINVWRHVLFAATTVLFRELLLVLLSAVSIL